MTDVWALSRQIAAEHGYDIYAIEGTCPMCGIKHEVNVFARSEAQAKELADDVDCAECDVEYEDEDEESDYVEQTRQT